MLFLLALAISLSHNYDITQIFIRAHYLANMQEMCVSKCNRLKSEVINLIDFAIYPSSQTKYYSNISAMFLQQSEFAISVAKTVITLQIILRFECESDKGHLWQHV